MNATLRMNALRMNATSWKKFYNFLLFFYVSRHIKHEHLILMFFKVYNFLSCSQ